MSSSLAVIARRFIQHPHAPTSFEIMPLAPSFRLVTWNHLAEDLDVHGDFTVDPMCLPWSFRSPLVSRVISDINPDIVCLQEVSDPATVARALPGFLLFYAPKPDSPALAHGGPPDGTALLVRRSRFAVTRCETLHFLDDTMAGGVDGHAIEISNQVAILAELRDRSAGNRVLIVGATHLKAKSGAINEAVREGQARQLLAAATAMRGGREDVPVVLGGDFNSSPLGRVYATVLRDPLCYSSAYNTQPRPASEAAAAATADGVVAATGVVSEADITSYAQTEPPFTTWKFRAPAGAAGADGATEKKETIDYVWYGGGRHLGCVATWGLPSESEIGPAALPSASYPSDHLALAVDFSWLVR